MSSSDQFVPIESQLTPDQRFRLVEIAHETKSDAVRVAALSVLSEQRRFVFRPGEPLDSVQSAQGWTGWSVRNP